MKPLKLLNTPHPFIYNWTSVVIPGAATILLLLVFAPFGMAAMALPNRIALACTIGLVVAGSVVLMMAILKRLVPIQTLEDQWTVGREIGLTLAVVVVITLLNFVVLFFWGIGTNDVPRLFQLTVLRTVLVSIFPIVLMVLVQQSNENRKQLKRAAAMAQQLQAQLQAAQNTSQTTAAQDKYLFETESGKPVMRLAPQEVAFVKSDGNYVEVYHKNEGSQLTKTLIRNKLKAFVDALPTEHFFHCHKSYLVNTSYIQAVRGNARNYEVRLAHHEAWLPVSRSKSVALTQRFQK